MNNIIPIAIKQQCCKMKNDGMPLQDIYYNYFCKNISNPQNLNSFRGSVSRWSRSNICADPYTLNAGTYNSFIAHDATVQVNGKGEIVQAWIKQKNDDEDIYGFLEAIKGSIEPYEFKCETKIEGSHMLEIPLFDMHWGIAFMDHYADTLDTILDVINGKMWDRIEIPFGQDFFHNDSICKGETTKGTMIEKVDTVRAVKDGKQFMITIIDAAIKQSNSVRVTYSPGNHDRSISWMFMQVLLERYGPEIIDDTISNRSIITYGTNAVMVTHGHSKRSTATNLALIFPSVFPKEFCNANIKEIHCGHLHEEIERDVFGVMVRRLATKNITDDWSDIEDYISSIKRFRLFEWSTDRLYSTIYV